MIIWSKYYIVGANQYIPLQGDMLTPCRDSSQWMSALCRPDPFQRAGVFVSHLKQLKVHSCRVVAGHCSAAAAPFSCAPQRVLRPLMYPLSRLGPYVLCACVVGSVSSKASLTLHPGQRGVRHCSPGQRGSTVRLVAQLTQHHNL